MAPLMLFLLQRTEPFANPAPALSLYPLPPTASRTFSRSTSARPEENGMTEELNCMIESLIQRERERENDDDERKLI
ncbi:hypothetical protein ACKLNR_004375 [Fusarium oxysporum f. sp. zingiberi]